jgi:hypothetical protein
VAAPRRRLTASGLIASPILFVIAIGMIIQSISALVSFAGSADTRDLAASIEKGFQPDPDYLARFVENNGLDHPSAGCGDAFTRARLTVSLAALEAAIKGNDVTLIDAAEKNALEIARRRLICNPLDGNAWLRYAMIDVQASGPAPEAIDALRQSYWSAPNESWVMEARLPFATRLYLAGAPGFDSEYLDDLRRFATYPPANQVAETYAQTAPQIQALLHPLIAAQPDARKKAILAEIDRLGVIFDQK